MTIQTVAYNPNITPNLTLGDAVLIGRLTGDLSLANPQNGVAGTLYRFHLETDGSPHAVTFGTQYRVSLDSLNIVPGQGRTTLRFFAWTSTLFVQLGNAVLERIGDMGQLGSGLGSDYPGAIDTKQFFVNATPVAPDGSSRIDAEVINDDLEATIALETTLGANPQGSYGSVRARLDQHLPTSGAPTSGAIPFYGSALQTDVANYFWDNTNKRLGLGTQTPQHRLDVLGTGRSQIHFGTALNQGGYLSSFQEDHAVLSAGAYFNGTAWVATAATANLLACDNGTVTMYADTSLTVGNTFTPTSRWTLAPTGAGSYTGTQDIVVAGVSQLRFAPSAGTNTGGFLTSTQNDHMVLSAAARFDGANWIAGDNAAVLIAGDNGQIKFYTNSALTIGAAFTPTSRGTITEQGGLVWGNATGGDKGSGTINAVGIFANNVLLTSFPLAHALDGCLDLAYWDRKTVTGCHAPARRFAVHAQEWCDVEQYVAYWQRERHLPAMPNPAQCGPEEVPDLGEMVQRLWETVDLQAVHTAQLLERIHALETAR